jgi:hypothetical protein
MIALARPTTPRRRGFEPGDRVTLDWPVNPYHGASGVVATVAGDQVGVTWELLGDRFYAPLPAHRIQLDKGGRR